MRHLARACRVWCRMAALHSRLFSPVVHAGIACLLFGLVCARAAGGGLIASSPFLSSQGGASAATMPGGAPFELHGIMVAPEGTLFSIYEPAKKTATWVRLDEAGLGFVVRAYRVVDGADQVIVDYDGGTLVLGLRTAKTAASSVARFTRDTPEVAGLEVRDWPGLNAAKLLPEEEGRRQIILGQVRNRVTQQRAAGQPVTSELLPDEMGHLQVLIGQVRNRLAREKQPPSPTNE